MAENWHRWRGRNVTTSLQKKGHTGDAFVHIALFTVLSQRGERKKEYLVGLNRRIMGRWPWVIV